MTTRDPVAAPEGRVTKSVRMSAELVDLLEAHGWEFGEPGPDGFYSPIVRSGYVLVNVEGLARLAYADRPPLGKRPVPWPPSTRKDWEAWAQRILAAIQEQER